MTRLVAAVLLVALQQQTPLDRLRASIERTTKSVNAAWGIYIKSLETNEEIALDADRQMETMSTIKIPLMVEVFEQIKAGKFALSDKYTFAQADSQPGTGTIQRLDPGAVMTATCLSSALATLLMGLWANYPIAVAPAMGHNFYFALMVWLEACVLFAISMFFSFS